MNNNSKPGYTRQWFFPFLLSLFIVFTACTEGEDIVGRDILPEGDQVVLSYSEGFNIQSKTLSIDSLISDENAFSSARPYNLLGSYADPVFGLSNASFLTEVRLSDFQVDFGEYFVPDSLVLYLELKSIYGEPRQSGSLDLFVYQLTDTIEKDSSYTSNRDFSGYFDQGNPVAHFSYAPAYADTIVAVKLNIESFIDVFSNYDNLESDASFRKEFKGLYLTTSPVSNQGSILAFNLLSEKSKMTLYYRNDSVADSPIIESSSIKSFDFHINENCARINLFQHDYASAETPIQHINEYNAEDTVMYIQSMAGLKAKLTLPDFSNWADSGNVVITRARLHLPILENSADKFAPPASLNLFNIVEDGESDDFPDLISNGTLYSEYFDGLYNSDIQAYEFNIAQYIQKIIRGELSNNGFYIAPYLSTNISSANRVILKGGSANEGVKLYISYIKL